MQLCIVNKTKHNIQLVMKTFKVPTREEVSLATYLTLSNAKSSLTIKEKEVINLIVSGINGCHYCTSAHTVIGKLNGFTNEQILEIRRGGISFDVKFNALAQFVKEVTNEKGKASQEAIDNFFAAGYTNESLVDTLMIISERTFSNYLNAIVDVPIDFPVAPEI